MNIVLSPAETWLMLGWFFLTLWVVVNKWG